MTEDIQLSEQDLADLAALEAGEVPNFHPILEVWREVLKPAYDELAKPVTPQWANRITSEYQRIDFADMNVFRDRYFGKIIELLEILHTEIATDADCLSYSSPAEDVENNTVHYENLLLAWQQTFLQWELEWDCTDEFAAVEMAAISEVYKMFWGGPQGTGISAFLDNIGFEFHAQEALSEALAEQREAWLSGAVTGE